MLVRAGGIVPLAAPTESDATVNPAALEIIVAPGADGAFTLVEDDGTGTDPTTIPTATTRITWEQATGTLTVHAAEGAVQALPAARTWTVTLLGVAGTGGVTLDGATVAVRSAGGRCSVELPDVPSARPPRLPSAPVCSRSPTTFPAGSSSC